LGCLENMRKNKIPAISVIMCVYNGGQYLDQAIESVLAQTFTDFELILIDDGSTDNSLERLKFYETIDTRCRVFTGSNKGMVASLNQGIGLAKADIIFRMDHDDICRPIRFEKQIRYLKEHPECVAVSSKVLLIDDEDLPIAEIWGETEHNKIDSVHLSGTGTYMCHPALAVRKADILKIGGYRQECHYAEDLDLFLRLAEIGKLTNFPEVLLEYRQHVESVGYAKRDKQIKATEIAVSDAKKRRGLASTINFDSAEEGMNTVLPKFCDIYLKWAWWAFLANNRQTAKKYAFKAFFRNPFKLELIKLFYCIYFK
jgi:glycosyltransferase involved in cell wall biosynthesis